MYIAIQKVVISLQALLKIVSHAKSGGNIEVMGLLQGRIRGDAFLITDCFRLPVEGTETRVNAGESANEYMVEFTELNEQTKYSNDSVCGWYHSHPGYGCWLSGIDVETELLYQSHQDPFVAIVVDPHRTAVAGRVEIGAFRTYPRGYTPPQSSTSQSDVVPLDKVRDFGVHANRYYSLKVEYYRSPLDDLVIDEVWRSYWADVLSTNNFEETRKQFKRDLTAATRKCLDNEGRDFNSYAERVHKCSCEYISSCMTNVLNRKLFAVRDHRTH
jgi:COP9 signalosome complex subunit 5